jgi:hypothetical protein
MVGWEFKHASEAIEKGVYVTWVSDKMKQGEDQCFRIGSESRCFCGHLFAAHANELLKSKVKSACTTCKCSEFKFIPRRPEELGLWHLPRRKGFDLNTWRPSCVCQHPHTDHSVSRPHKCKCGCFNFQSDFCCLSCD